MTQALPVGPGQSMSLRGYTEGHPRIDGRSVADSRASSRSAGEVALISDQVRRFAPPPRRGAASQARYRSDFSSCPDGDIGPACLRPGGARHRALSVRRAFLPRPPCGVYGPSPERLARLPFHSRESKRSNEGTLCHGATRSSEPQETHGPPAEAGGRVA